MLNFLIFSYLSAFKISSSAELSMDKSFITSRPDHRQSWHNFYCLFDTCPEIGHNMANFKQIEKDDRDGQKTMGCAVVLFIVIPVLYINIKIGKIVVKC